MKNSPSAMMFTRRKSVIYTSWCQRGGALFNAASIHSASLSPAHRLNERRLPLQLSVGVWLPQWRKNRGDWGGGGIHKARLGWGVAVRLLSVWCKRQNVWAKPWNVPHLFTRQYKCGCNIDVAGTLIKILVENYLLFQRQAHGHIWWRLGLILEVLQS